MGRLARRFGGMPLTTPQPPTGEAPALLDRIVTGVAVFGGLISLAIALTVIATVAGRNLRGEGVPGDFEYVQMGTAVAVFCFLPLCQLRRGNIVVDTFSAKWPPRLRAAVDALWDLVYAAIMGLLAWTLLQGALDTRTNGTATMVVGIPIWPAVLACAVLCALLSLVCVVTAWRLISRPA
jgi:TRAP-type C4-dicarboxylate transport system permease small subunit